MAAGPVFPAYLKLEHQRDPRSKTSFLAEVDAMLGDAERKFTQFSSEARRQLDSALSVKRNNVGSLDLGVDELKAAAAAQQARAQAAREVAQATALAAKEEGDYSQNARLAIAASQALAREEEQAAAAALSHARAAEQVQERLNRQASSTDLVVQATQRGTTAQQNVINSTRASRVAFVQLGQQMQDVTVQAQMGTNAFIIFSQQMPQAMFALSGLEASANKTQARIGAMATTLSGPWGAAIFGATALLGPLIIKMIASGDAAENAKNSVEKLTEKLREDAVTARNSEVAHAAFNKTLEGRIALQKKLTDELDKTLKSQREVNQEVLKNARTEAAQLKIGAGKLSEQLAAATRMRDQIKGLVTEGLTGTPEENQAIFASLARAEADVDRIGKALRMVQEAAAGAEVAINKALVPVARDEAKILSDPIAAINEKFDVMASNAEKAALGNRKLAESLKFTLANIDKQRDAALKAQRALEGATNANRQYGREIDHVAARSIAERKGWRVTSDLRSRAEQQWLYDNRRTPTNPVARPGTSAHEKGNALDIAFGPGVTPASLRKAYAEEGVRLTKILKEDGHFHIEWSTSGADKAQREAEQLAQFGQRATESIARITEQFDDQPKLIDRAAQATRQLNDVIKKLGDQQPAGFEEMIQQAQEAQKVVAEGMLRPFRDFMEDAERSQQIQSLILQGREEEAEAMQIMFGLEDQLGSEQELRLGIQSMLTQGRTEEAAILQQMLDKYPAMRREVMGVVQAQRQQTEELRAQQEVIDAYMSSISSVRSGLEGLLSGDLSGKGFFKGLQDNFKRLQAQLTTERLFGPMLRDLEEQMRKSTGIKSSVDIFKEGTESAGNAATTMAEVMERAADRIDAVTATVGRSAAIGGVDSGGLPNAVSAQDWSGILASAGLGSESAANDNGVNAAGEIVVNGRKVANGVAGMSVSQYAGLLGQTLTAPLAKVIEEQLGLRLPKEMQGIFANGMQGYLTGGAPGGVFGALKGGMQAFGEDIFGEELAGKISGKLDKALGGAQTGTQVAGLMKAFGIKTSTTGAQIGGSIGSLTGLPGGDIIGSIAGGLIGGLLKKTRTASATITGVDSVSLSGKKKGSYDEAGDLADSVIEGLKKIANAFDADIGSFNTSIGLRGKDIRVNTDGTSLKSKNGAVDFGEDAAAAIAFAIADAIKDGAFGATLSKQVQNLLTKTGSDLDTQVQKALDFQGVFKRLKQLKDPVGAAIDDLNDEFRGMIDLFNEAGASAEQFAQLEELYGLERAEAIKQATNQMVSSLQSFYDQLTIGDTGLSLRSRKDAALARYAPLAERVRAGDASAYDDFTSAADALLGIERQLSGSMPEYFDLLGEVTSLTKQAMDAQTGLAGSYSGRDSPFTASSVPSTDNKSVVTAIDNLGVALIEGLGAKLDAVNANLGKLATTSAANSNSMLAQYAASAGNF